MGHQALGQQALGLLFLWALDLDLLCLLSGLITGHLLLEGLACQHHIYQDQSCQTRMLQDKVSTLAAIQ